MLTDAGSLPRIRSESALLVCQTAMHHNADTGDGGGRLNHSMFVRARGLATVLAVPVLVSACSLGSLNPLATSSPSPSPAPTQTPSSSPVSNQGATSAVSRLPVPQDLTFDGPITGRVDNAVTSCGGGNGQYNAALISDIGSTHLTVYLTLVNDKGPGNYPAGNGDGTINIAVHTQSVDYFGSSGGFTIADDHRSGTINTVFTGGLRVTGKWTCATT
jgi:hypothetical protein